MRAYMLLSTDPDAVSKDAASIESFLDTNLDVLAHGGSPKKGGIRCKDCKPWNTLKKGIKEASVQPLDLVKKNMETTDSEERQPSVFKRIDWYEQVSGSQSLCFYCTSKPGSVPPSSMPQMGDNLLYYTL